MNLKILNIVLCVMLVNILGNCTLGAGSQYRGNLLENESFTFITLEELKQDPYFIATYGRIPVFESMEERKQWLDTIHEIYDEVNTDREMSKYLSPNGPIVGYGFSVFGYLKVRVKEEVDDTFMNDVYKIFDSHAEGKGVNEVPLVFFRGNSPIPVDAPVKKNASEVESSKNQQNKTESQPSEEKSNRISGFSFVYGLCGLYLVCRIRC